MKRIVWHTGTRNSGTSAIQEWPVANRANLRDHGSWFGRRVIGNARKTALNRLKKNADRF